MFDLKEELKKLPDKPGVYLMHDKGDHIIYVGKAVNLKNRVRQYFQNGGNKSPKILRMVSQIAWFEFIVTDSETEALVLECNLIKEHHPKYNTMLTDDKGYPFIRVTVEEAYPRILIARTMKRTNPNITARIPMSARSRTASAWYKSSIRSARAGEISLPIPGKNGRA